jgi:hypothetical protein
LNLKLLVNNKELWDLFLGKMESRIGFYHKQLEQSRDTDEMFRLQGKIEALRWIKTLREQVNGPEPSTKDKI